MYMERFYSSRGKSAKKYTHNGFALFFTTTSASKIQNQSAISFRRAAKRLPSFDDPS